MDKKTETTTEKKGGRSFKGTVVSAKMKDTIVVSVERYEKHPKYKKFMRLTKKLMAHDAGNTKAEGDMVTIKETRPMSRRKSFIVVN